MKKLKKSWNIKYHIILAFILAAIGQIAAKLNMHNSAASIGIIGGADGPTAIFVAGGPGSFFFINAVGIIIFIIILALYKLFKCVIDKYFVD